MSLLDPTNPDRVVTGLGGTSVAGRRARLRAKIETELRHWLIFAGTSPTANEGQDLDTERRKSCSCLTVDLLLAANAQNFFRSRECDVTKPSPIRSVTCSF